MPNFLLNILQFVAWLMIFACTWCRRWLLFFIWDCGWPIVLHIVIYSGVMFFSLGDSRPPTCTHPSTLQGVYTDAHRFHHQMLVDGAECLFDDVQRFPLRKWLHFDDAAKSNSILPFDLFITQSGTCTLRPPPLLFCFLSHRRQMSSDIIFSPVSSTAIKHKVLKD